ncbi:SET domain-containing protein [Candidatus Kaiserbacteria bacterium]|nr:SET domain-containing protein [Candidatus Kaiserbacteria bacterium]
MAEISFVKRLNQRFLPIRLKVLTSSMTPSQITAKLGMSDVIIGKGNLAGKGVYANRDFKAGEIVIQYHLKSLTEEEFQNLPESEKEFTHIYRGVIRLYSGPERYVNHSANPNTSQDLENGRDVALRDIKKGGVITTDATKDDSN